MNSSNFVILVASFLLWTSFLVQFSDGKKGDKGTSGEEQCSTNKGENQTGVCTKLALVQVIFRHGDRTPLFTWPTDPHNHKNSNSTFAKMFQRHGLLTKRGKVQAYELGTFLGTRYKDFLQGTWIPDDIHVISSEVERTIMTAQALLAGLFPPSLCPDKEPGGCEGKWSKDIRWQPIPVYPIPRDSDNKINNYYTTRKRCPVYQSELESVLTCDMMTEYISLHQKVMDDVKKNTRLEKVNIKNIGLVYDTLFVQTSYDLPLPNWTRPHYPSPLKEMEEMGFLALSGDRKMMKFNGGPLLQEVIGNMKNYGKCSPKKKSEKDTKINRQKKLYLYSGHDTTVAAFLATLNLLYPHQPAYTSAVIIELHEPIIKNANGSGGRSIVKVFYRNATRAAAQELIIKDCGNPCYLDKLEQVSRDLFVSDWKRECNGTNGWIGWALQPLSKFFAKLFKLLTYVKNIITGRSRADCGGCTETVNA